LDPFPEEIKRFLDENIRSVEQLEMLRVLGEVPDYEWAAAELAGRLQVQPQAVAPHLAALDSRGLLVSAKRGADLFCRYGPRTPELEEKLGRLLQLYKERPVTMIRMVYARAKEALQTLADAFRLRKEG
jgi:DNA-binding MarR family transcriptional regulator